MWDKLTLLQKAIALFVIIIVAVIAFKIIIAGVMLAWDIFTLLFPLFAAVVIIYAIIKFVQVGEGNS